MMSRTRRNHVLSPSTAKALVESFAQIPQVDLDSASSSSDSPDSLYSNNSPIFANQSFEFDVDELELADGEEYEVGPVEGFDTPSWGKWPETTTAGSGWSPSPSTAGTPLRTHSIISVSPRCGSNSSRRGSLPRSKLDGDRRDSNPSLLGFELCQRRRSSIRSFTSSLRRSSVVSSVIDPLEDARLRYIASMNSLGRRFSEVVEVTGPDSDSEAGNHTNMARQAFSQWSPYSTDNESDYSEIMTASYAPTPEVASLVPAILSNFPLASVAQQPATPSDISGSPIMPLFTRSRRQFSATPSPEPNPAAIIRNRTRPMVARSVSEYQFPPKTSSHNGVPPGAAPPRPSLSRSTSTPFFPVAQDKVGPVPVAAVPPLFPAGPLGVSPLRKMSRRESTHSDGDMSRRSSIIERRRSSLVDRRASLADRRTSLVNEARRESSDSRRGSLTRSGSRKASIASIRRSSVVSATRRSSQSSRKGSWVESAAEFAYLAPQIVIERAEPALPSPAYISFPGFSFGSASPNTPTPRFNPMESFFNTAASSPASVNGPLSSSSEMDRTPTLPSLPISVINRGRPVSSPEFAQPFPFWSKPTTSQNTAPQELRTPVGILRKPVPKMSVDELSAEAKRDQQMRVEKELEQQSFERRGAGMYSAREQALLRGAGAHRRTASGNEAPAARRPVRGRQTTLPVELETSRQRQRRSVIMPPLLTSSPEERPSENSKISKRASVTFVSNDAHSTDRTRPNMSRASSFSRFFHSRAKSASAASVPDARQTRPPVRPLSGDSSGSDRTLVEVRDIFKKLGGMSPRRSSDEEEGKVPFSRVVL